MCEPSGGGNTSGCADYDGFQMHTRMVLCIIMAKLVENRQIWYLLVESLTKNNHFS